MSKKNNKGGQFEREIAKRLSLWWTKNKRDDVFWRTPGSGSRATVRMKNKIKTNDSAGDILSIDESGKPFTNTFLVEVKRGYSKQISLLGFIDINVKKRNLPLLFKWIKKADKEKRQHKRKNIIIIFKRDRRRPCVLLKYKVFENIASVDKDIVYAIIIFRRIEFVVVPLDDFFSRVDPNQFKI